MSLRTAVECVDARQRIAAAAVAEARVCVSELAGLRSTVVGAGFDTIQRLRPSFLERHVAALLPGWADVVDPYWADTPDADGPVSADRERVRSNADDVAAKMMGVTDRYVDRSTDEVAIAVYRRLRPRAEQHIVAEIDRLVSFVDAHRTTKSQ